MESPTPRFEFYEKVLVTSSNPRLRRIHGLRAAVLGRDHDAVGTWYYAIHVYRRGLVWCVSEADLQPTGEFDTRYSFYSGCSVTVRVDESGRGRLVDRTRDDLDSI